MLTSQSSNHTANSRQPFKAPWTWHIHSPGGQHIHLCVYFANMLLTKHHVRLVTSRYVLLHRDAHTLAGNIPDSAIRTRPVWTIIHDQSCLGNCSHPFQLLMVLLSMNAGVHMVIGLQKMALTWIKHAAHSLCISWLSCSADGHITHVKVVLP